MGRIRARLSCRGPAARQTCYAPSGARAVVSNRTPAVQLLGNAVKSTWTAPRGVFPWRLGLGSSAAALALRRHASFPSLPQSPPGASPPHGALGAILPHPHPLLWCHPCSSPFLLVLTFYCEFLANSLRICDGLFVAQCYVWRQLMLECLHRSSTPVLADGSVVIACNAISMAFSMWGQGSD